MADEITIRLKMNIETGKKDIVIELRSDASALPYEHEQKHREVVEKLLGEGVFKPGELGEVSIERVKEGPSSSSENTPPTERPKEQASH